MKIIYKYKKENYELEINEENADNYVIETFEKNFKKCRNGNFIYDCETQTEFLNFQQFCFKSENDFVNGKINGNDRNAIGGNNQLSCAHKKEKWQLNYVNFFEKSGYIVKEGDIYGADYLLYLSSEKYTHAAYVVYTVSRSDVIRDLIRVLRLSHSIKKNVILILQKDIESEDISDNIVYVQMYSYK
ncbi:tRNA intron endonuclease [Plasmodium gonderi]|uniref:tRNA-intron lyase n=1 Tax=Plasmodium gonderi TaxID=77519 RepID=A0A1Y1JTW0_PLAGO|nr:tRNA intron endonuclease [Plasmodium gonderi]GAW83843.1 tRNA intron endonuclease [Plasmodium gonderi]